MALGLLLTLFWPSPAVSHLVQDLRTWMPFFEYTRMGRIPYADFTKEYPVLGGALYWLMSPLVEGGNLRQIVLVHGLLMTAADLINTVLFFRAVREWSPRLALPFTLALNLSLTALVMTPVRYESWTITFVLLGYLAHRRGRFLTAAAWWSVGCGLKWYPAFLLAAQEWKLFAGERRRWHWLGAAAVLAAVTAAVNLPFVVVALLRTGSLAHWVRPYVFHAIRPLYWDTVLGVGQIWLGPLPWERYAGLWSLGLMVAVLLVRPRLPIEEKGTLVCLAAILFNRIYSAQFNLWFYPLLLLAAARAAPARREALLLLFVLLDLLTVIVFPASFTWAVEEMGGFFPYGAWQGGGPWTVVFSLAIAARALTVAALAAVLLRRAPTDQGRSLNS